MKPFLPVNGPLGAPLLLLVLVGGAIALTDYWMRHRLPETFDPSRGRTAATKPRRPFPRRRPRTAANGA